MISILRLDHRIHRDIRVTTHLALTARALLAQKFYYTGQKDSKFENTISKMNNKFGSDFEVIHLEDHIKFLTETNSLKIHLTVYGQPLISKIDLIRKSDKDIIVIVGGKKVPPVVYNLADFNLSITSQPISEISAVAIFLNELLERKPLSYKFESSKIRIVPQEKGKKVIKDTFK